MTGAHRLTTSWITCPCGKRGYATKRAARVAAIATPDHQRMRQYRCRQQHGVPALWHNGHLPAVVIRGLITRRTS